jgi:hypothetical protein
MLLFILILFLLLLFLLLLLGAAMMYILEPCKQSEAISIATSLGEDLNKRTIEVCLAFYSSRFAKINIGPGNMFRNI